MIHWNYEPLIHNKYVISYNIYGIHIIQNSDVTCGLLRWLLASLWLFTIFSQLWIHIEISKKLLELWWCPWYQIYYWLRNNELSLKFWSNHMYSNNINVDVTLTSTCTCGTVLFFISIPRAISSSMSRCRVCAASRSFLYPTTTCSGALPP